MGNKPKIRSKLEDDNLTGKNITANPAITSPENKIRFSLIKCDTSSYCIRKLNSRNLIQDLYKELSRFENITWSQLISLNRTSGLCIEKKESENYVLMSEKFPGFSTFGHFRVGSKERPKFRVFGARHEDLFYILMFDIDGRINHK